MEASKQPYPKSPYPIDQPALTRKIADAIRAAKPAPSRQELLSAVADPRDPLDVVGVAEELDIMQGIGIVLVDAAGYLNLSDEY